MCQLFKARATGLSIKMSGYAKECFGYKLVSKNDSKKVGHILVSL
jgi:hypothetical protein